VTCSSGADHGTSFEPDEVFGAQEPAGCERSRGIVAERVVDQLGEFPFDVHGLIMNGGCGTGGPHGTLG
jgi:hypothetical protein